MTDWEHHKTDEELVSASLAGSHDSYTCLVRRYQHLVYGLCRNMLGQAEDAMDSAQDVFIVAYKRLHELRTQADFKPWLRQIATNTCRQSLRGRRLTGELEDYLGWVDPYEGILDSIDINRALATLSSDTRLAVLLFYFEGSSIKEIATFCTVPESTVMSRLRNARSQLRRDLNYMFEEPIKRSSLPEDFADQIPIPYDEYGPHRGANDYQPLSNWRSEWLLSAFPDGSSIVTSEILGYEWEALPDREVQVVVRIPNGSKSPVRLRMSGRKDGILAESALLPILGELGLPVPKFIAGPATDPDMPDRGMLLATTPPVGKSALAWAVDGGIKAVDQACNVVLEAIEWVKSLTAAIESSSAAKLLERCTLSDELTRIGEIAGPWMSNDRFKNAFDRLQPVVNQIDVPLVFSDSGIGPNTRVDDQGNLVGFETFAWARIEDPHYQITKYWTYDCWPIRRAGFVERYLISQNLSMQEFASRLGVRALATLQREIPVEGGDEGYRNEMLGWLELAMKNI